MNIKFLIMDVDGTLTDGMIYMGENGELFKAFNIKDGCGIKDLLPEYGIIPVIITARKSRILEKRCKELSIYELHQDVRNKLEKIETVLNEYNKSNNTNYNLSNCAYIGDDILDIKCMKAIKQSHGLTGCPSDAISSVKDISYFISKNSGGHGSVREYIEYIINNRLYEE